MTSITCKSYDEIDKNMLYAILQLRHTIFTLEQQCVYQDMDNNDQYAHHCLLVHNDILSGYCRILPPHIKHEYPSIGRYALLKESRGKGFGKTLFAYAIKQTQTLYPNAPIYIQAQHYLHAFYHNFGFKQISHVYNEAGVAHVDMVLDNIA